MKKLIPLIAIAVAMAQAVTYYDYTTETPTIEWVETAINDGDITFNPEGAKDAFLALVEDLYDYRDAENWSACVTTAGSLEAATTYINGDVKGQVAELCDATEEIYGYDEDDFTSVEITPADEEDIRDNLVSVDFEITICITIQWLHLEVCDYKRGEHQEEACKHKLRFTID